MENLKTQGISLPRLGLGTFRMQGDVCRAAVESALKLGYRHIDTAEMYGNEDAIGVANFNIALLKTVVEEIKAPIACNQIEYHVLLDQTPVRKYLAAKSIPLVAYCPLAQGRAATDERLIASFNPTSARSRVSQNAGLSATPLSPCDRRHRA